MILFRDFFYELFLKKGVGESWAPTLPKICVFDLKNNLSAKKKTEKITKTISEKYRRYSILIETVKTPRDSAYEILSPGWGDDGHNHLNHMIRGIINSM